MLASNDYPQQTRGDYRLSADPSQLDLAAIHAFLTESYWAKGIPLNVVERSVHNSVCFGLYHHQTQVGFARVVTDRATFAYLADVYVLPQHRGQGLSKWMMQYILDHPSLQGLRRWLLATRDAHGLYAQFGFTPLPEPGRFMQRHNPQVYVQEPT